MEHTKPVVFFSHASSDAPTLTRLKRAFEEKTGGTIEIFLSSDGQSIQFGRNWVHRVEEAMGQAKLMVVFVSPESADSKWIYFESGFAYAKDLQVVPVALPGVDLSDLPPPLGLLQGFNIRSEDGLNNLIALVNEVFGHRHQEVFSKEDYLDIFKGGLEDVTGQLGTYGEYVRALKITIPLSGAGDLNLMAALGRIEEFLMEEGVHCHREGEKIDFFGVSIRELSVRGRDGLTVLMDPILFDVTWPLLSRTIDQIRKLGFKGCRLSFFFSDDVQVERERFRVSARIYGTPARIGDEGKFVIDPFEVHLLSFGKRPPEARCDMLETDLDDAACGDLLDFLFERRLLFMK